MRTRTTLNSPFTGIEQVSSFVDSLPRAACEKYDECLAVFNEHRGRLFSVRNKATFHYPALRPDNAQAARPVRRRYATLLTIEG